MTLGTCGFDDLCDALMRDAGCGTVVLATLNHMPWYVPAICLVACVGGWLLAKRVLRTIDRAYGSQRKDAS